MTTEETKTKVEDLCNRLYQIQKEHGELLKTIKGSYPKIKFLPAQAYNFRSEIHGFWGIFHKVQNYEDNSL